MRAHFQFIISMIIFGTIGMLVQQIPLTASQTALLSSTIGGLFLLIFQSITHAPINWRALWHIRLRLVLAGSALSGNWLFLYAAYHYTSIATATLIYYLAPVIVIAGSALFFHETITTKQVLCVIVSLLGLALVIGTNIQSTKPLGLVLGLCAAVCYAVYILLNKTIVHQHQLSVTTTQIMIAAGILLLITTGTHGIVYPHLSAGSWLLVGMLGIINVGIGFWLFLISIPHLSGQKIAILSYLDPLVALFISLVCLHQPTTIEQLIGGGLILLATLFDNLSFPTLLRQRWHQ